MEFLSPEDVSREAQNGITSDEPYADGMDNDEEDVKPDVRLETIVQADTGKEIDEEREEEEEKKPSHPDKETAGGPVIRVRLDEHTADVGVEDLVSREFYILSDVRTDSPLCHRSSHPTTSLSGEG